MTALTAHPSEALQGSLTVPGDKSISHRALMLGGLAVGETSVSGLLEGEDVLATAAAMRALGAEIQREVGPDGKIRWRLWGRGIGGLREPDQVIDLGNSGTGARLLVGLLASHPLTAVITGDASLRRRPMARVIEPLTASGAQFFTRSGGRLPLTVVGTDEPRALSYRLPVPSAQVKSAVLLAGLAARGTTEVFEPEACRDHSERMLGHFGATITLDPLAGGGRRIALEGQPELQGQALSVPGDPSSAAFPLVAALLVPGSEVVLPGVGLNPTRNGLFVTLEEMGADIAYENRRDEGGEPVADIRVKASALTGVEIPAARAPTMIDEYPVLAVAAACATGRTVMQGLAELRVKESDRLTLVAKGLAATGVSVEEGTDSLVVTGCGGNARPRGGATIASALDHRIAMAFLVLGLAAERPVTVDDASPIATSFPGFAAMMKALGADLRQAAAETT